jgi:hypothetical protein
VRIVEVICSVALLHAAALGVAGVPTVLAEASVSEMEPAEDGPFVQQSYLRVTFAVEGTALSVTDAAVVDGPLLEQPDLTGDIAYQVVLDRRRIASEAFPDPGEVRSIAPPDDPDRGHHFSQRPNFEISVRIPLDAIGQEDLGRIEIELFRLRRAIELSGEVMPPAGVPFGPAAVARDLPPPERVARRVGILLQDLDPAAADAIERALR